MLQKNAFSVRCSILTYRQDKFCLSQIQRNEQVNEDKAKLNFLGRNLRADELRRMNTHEFKIIGTKNMIMMMMQKKEKKKKKRKMC